jgi:hypothetical protein
LAAAQRPKERKRPAAKKVRRAKKAKNKRAR